VFSELAREAFMNVTLSVDEELLRRAREVARRQGTSLNELFREYLRVLAAGRAEADPAEELFALMDKAGGRLDGRTWTREEAHERG
jgi:hypothetical protein